MISIFYQYHDYRPEVLSVDTTKLDANNYVDRQILDAVKKNNNKVHVDGYGWESNSKFNNEPPEINRTAVVENYIGPFDRTIHLDIDIE